ncbi:MAG: hypothetical protein HOH18_04935 [Kordiimonadaceae bacterium]|nr:hypothetical protein [Kordiimonadaceae bacterium]MBT6035801.1 hypothetical protein [Kordiimonadaceae bacterium]
MKQHLIVILGLDPGIHLETRETYPFRNGYPIKPGMTELLFRFFHGKFSAFIIAHFCPKSNSFGYITSDLIHQVTENNQFIIWHTLCVISP